MDIATFDKFRELIYNTSGISINEGKISLVTARVGKRMRTLGLSDHRSYYDYVVADRQGEEIVYLLDAISTNVTSFFRENDHFDRLKKVLSTRVTSGVQKIRIWCAAASTGEEPYTIAMTVREVIGNRKIDVKILATDKYD